MNLELQKVMNYLDEQDMYMGKNYDKNSVIYNGKIVHGREDIFVFKVRDKFYGFRNISIGITNNEITKLKCDCRNFKFYRSCEHLGACFHHYFDLIFNISPIEKQLDFTKEILNKYYQPKKEEVKLKKQLTLEITANFEEGYYGSNVSFNFKIGENKLYSLNNKLNRFLTMYDEPDEELTFGKNFTYSSSKYFFSKEDKKIIDYLEKLRNQNPYYNFQYFSLDSNQAKNFFDILKGKNINILGYGVINKISEEIPFQINLSKDDNYYHLKIDTKGFNILLKDYSWVLKEDTLYCINEEIKEIVQNMKRYNIKELLFKENDLKAFSKGLLKLIKNKSVLIVDDIITTCATIETCSQVLKNAKNIYGCAIARSNFQKNKK